MELYELRKKKGLASSVYAIAFVKNPAIEVGFVALSQDSNPKTITRIKLNAEKRMIYTPVLIPNQKIYREDEAGNGYQIFFSENTIEEAAHDFVAAKLTDEFNNEHSEHEKLEGISLVENWIIEDPKSDKATQLGFELPKGTWMAGIKVRDEDIWAKCKNGTYQGISIEGLFDNFETKMNINKNTEMDKKEETAKSMGEKLDGFLAELKGLVATKTELASAELQDGGSVYTEGEWEDGVNVYTDEALETPAADGEYVLADGRVMAVSGGKVAGLREAVEEDLMKKKEYMEKVEQLAKYLVDFKEELNSVKEELSSYREKLTALEAEKEEVKKETSEVKAELSKVKETPVGKSAQKLSEVAQREGRFNNALRGERFKMNH